jgi:hypothetical protein
VCSALAWRSAGVISVSSFFQGSISLSTFLQTERPRGGGGAEEREKSERSINITYFLTLGGNTFFSFGREEG